MRPIYVRASVVAALLVAVAMYVWKRDSPARQAISSSPASSPLAAIKPPAVATQPPGPSKPATAPVNIRQAIDDGAQALNSMHFNSLLCGAPDVKKIVGKGKKRRTIVMRVDGLRRCLGDYLLAVADSRGHIEVIEVFEGRPVKGYDVRVQKGGKRRGVNVPFTVTHPPGHTVVGLKTAVHDGPNMREDTYVPYSAELDVPELRAEGLRYLERIGAQALSDLRARDVRSRHFSDKKVADLVELAHLVALGLTEQMKSDVLFENGSVQDRIEMINRTLVILGANGEGACRFTRSRTGASGLAQLMPGTYRRLANAYPKAKLPTDLDARLDHEQAMIAMVLHADDEWWAVSGDPALRSLLLTTPYIRRLMLAAGYNANVGRVVRAIKTCGNTWRDRSCTTLPEETRRYLVKYEAVWNLLYAADPQPSPTMTSAAHP